MINISYHLEANLCLFIEAIEGVRLVDVRLISTAAGVVRIVLLVLLSLVTLGVLSHGMDFPLGGVQHDGENLKIS